MVEADGERYHGEFVRGERSGAGRLRHSNGDVFEGDFLAGLRHGPGKLTTAAGATFEGVWRDDTLDGPVHHSGQLYDPDLEGGVRRTYANGDVYRGEWGLSLIHISEPTRQAEISYAVFCLKKKKSNGPPLRIGPPNS